MVAIQAARPRGFAVIIREVVVGAFIKVSLISNMPVRMYLYVIIKVSSYQLVNGSYKLS